MGASEAGEGAITTVDGLATVDNEVAGEEDLDSDLVLFLGEDIFVS